MGLLKVLKDRMSEEPNMEGLPNLTVYLSSPQDKVFKPNDMVSGHISLSLTTPTPITPQAIEVSFWGHSRVWIRVDRGSKDSSEYWHYRDNASLFTVAHNLLEKPQQLQLGQQYTYPFNFRVPVGTQGNRTGYYKDDSDQRWTVCPHLLPPSFLWGRGSNQANSAEIMYGVTARLICPGIGVGRRMDPLESVAPILFQPLNTHMHAPLSVIRYPKALSLSSSALSGQEAASLGFRQKMSDLFSKDTPKLDFEVGLELPDYLSTGSEFRFRSTFHVVNKTQNVVQVPAITFTILKLELLDFTAVRAPRDKEASRMMFGSHGNRGTENAPNPPLGPSHGQETRRSEQKLGLNALPGSKVVLLEDAPAAGGEKKGFEQRADCEVWFTARIPGHTPPSFQSFAVSRNYRIKAKIGVEVAGKKFEAEAESHVRSLGGVAGPEFLAGPQGPADSQLPAYSN